jgi:enoyl-CoA hydratase/carnithine racemase
MRRLTVSKGYRTIKLKKKRHTAWITLDRPDKLNAINEVMLQELSEATDNLEEDANVRCIVITGEGEKAFSAGADLTELQKLTQETAAEFSVKGQQVFSKLEKLSKPVVAAINGYALGGGLELALACDFRIAADSAELGCPETKLGFIPAWGATQRLPLAVGLSYAKRLLMLGDRIQADEAYKMGLVDKVVPLERLETEAEELAQRLCEYPPAALKYAKRAVNSVTESLLKSGLKKETDFFAQLFSTTEVKKNIEDFLGHRETKNRETAKSE